MNIQNIIDKTWGQFMIQNVIYIICVKFTKNLKLHILHRDIFEIIEKRVLTSVSNHLTQLFKDHFVLDGWAFSRTESTVIQFFCSFTVIAEIFHFINKNDCSHWANQSADFNNRTCRNFDVCWWPTSRWLLPGLLLLYGQRPTAISSLCKQNIIFNCQRTRDGKTISCAQ